MEGTEKAAGLTTHEPSQFWELGAGPPEDFPYPDVESLTLKRFHEKARPMVRRLFKNWETLSTMVERFEGNIQKRWLKKSELKRKALLLAAWPDMPKSHRPDLAAFKVKKGRDLKAKDPTPYLWPNINLEDLSKDRPLLLMINSRGRNAPDNFFNADVAYTRFGVMTHSIALPYVQSCIAMFRGRKTPETYGEVYSLPDGEELTMRALRGGTNAGAGLWVLEIQDRLYDFLVKCCQSIMHDVPEQALTHPGIPLQPETLMISAVNEAQDTKSFAVASLEAPYRLPAALDFNWLESVVGAKLADTRDHLLSMREDPSYFASTLLEWGDHGPEILPNLNDRVQTSFFRKDVDLFWERVIGAAIMYALNLAEAWHVIHQKVSKLRELAQKHSESINADFELSDDLSSAFSELHFHLISYMREVITPWKLQHTFASSPEMRPSLARFEHEPQNPKKIFKTRIQKEISWTFCALADQKQAYVLGEKTLLTQIELSLRNNPETKSYISSLVSKQLADYSMLHDCKSQIELFEPWTLDFGRAPPNLSESLRHDFLETSKYLYRFPKRSSTLWSQVSLIGQPLNGRFHYPAEKKRTRESVNAMRRAESYLDGFWYVVVEHLKCADALPPHLHNILAGTDLQRTEPWVELPKISQRSETIKSGNRSVFSDVSHVQNISERTELEKVVKKEKVKTKGIPSKSLGTHVQDPNILSPNKSDQPMIKVSKRAMKVFRTLFFNHAVGSQPGEIAWKEFLYAMTYVGFEAQKLYGSIWHFRPTKSGVERGIQFHEPHPVAKIPFTLVRRFRRHLGKVYGWHGEMFGLED
ncbi:hypothetical protein F5Y15DRAFT_143279 [Xylariaceae sp. FL0016]|nr:hypothetical protein F5Y15DRAFT_143279 [Xylariaceae sp. FL0016]